MVNAFLPDNFLPDFMELLRSIGEVHGPIESENGVPAFGPVGSWAEVRLDIMRTLIPPKKYLLPASEKLLTYTCASGYELPQPVNRKIVLLGLHACDLAGIAYLDRVFLSSIPDPTYERSRRNLTLIGMSCEPDPSCFCGEMGIIRPSGFDLFFDRTGDGFHIRCGTERGTDILIRGTALFSERQAPSLPVRERTLPVNPIETVAGSDPFPASPLWEKFSARCLSCGACSACCPTCYCYDVTERGGFEGGEAERFRRWDNCLFKTYGEVAGSINFRPTRLERLQYRFTHKFRGFGPLRGVPSCVGCGRCAEICPVAIDLLDLFRDPATGKET